MDDEKKTEGQTLIDYRLDKIEKKLDTVTDILLQTQAQELRLASLEKGIGELKKDMESKIAEHKKEWAEEISELKTAIDNITKAKTRNIDRWLTPLISALVSGGVAFILIKVGLK